MSRESLQHQGESGPGSHGDADALSIEVGVEPLGGDPPCWAHLFEDESDLARAAGPGSRGDE